jgi:MFS family permease
VVLDATVVNIALPSAQRDLGFANSDRQWVVTAYALAFGGLLLLGGRVGLLVTARALQGAFCAIFPSAIATATAGVLPQDTGVASALVNTMQQVGGSGTELEQYTSRDSEVDLQLLRVAKQIGSVLG